MEIIADGNGYDLAIRVAIGMGLLVGLVVIGFLVIRKISRWARTESAPQTLTLQDFREMRERGEMSEAEFEAIKAAYVRKATQKDADSPQSPQNDQ